ncbi:hypothetical protein M2169_003553 [Streptomyces sp. MJP52]|nr:hypothetical protein [Streptomyces sp. MJP52]
MAPSPFSVRGAADDLVDAGALPVLAVGVVEDGDVAAAADVLGDRPGAVVHGRGEGGVRGAEERGADARRAGERQLVLGELPVDARPGLEREVGVVEGVQADLVALVDHAPHEARVAGGHGAGDEEDRVGVVLLQHVQHLGRPLRVRAVVEGEDQTVVGHAQPLGLPGTGVDDGTALEDLLRHPVGRGGRLDPVVGEDLAVDVAAQHQHHGHDDQEQRGQQEAQGQQRGGPTAWAASAATGGRPAAGTR